MNIAEIAQEGQERLERPGKVVYITGEGPDITFDTSELHERGVRFGTALRDLGVEPGDRIAVLIPNEPSITALYHGINRMGGVVLPILFLLALHRRAPEVRGGEDPPPRPLGGSGAAQGSRRQERTSARNGEGLR